MDKNQNDDREVVFEGKTKIARGTEDAFILNFEYKDQITRNDNKSETEEFPTKAVDSNAVNTRMMTLLAAAGLPVAFIKQSSPRSFFARHCERIQLEVVARRRGKGSFYKRHPELDGTFPRFSPIRIEFYYKTSEGIGKDRHGNVLHAGLAKDDPLIINPNERVWLLKRPDLPLTSPDSAMPQSVVADEILCNPEKEIPILGELTTKAFLIVEKALALLGLRLIDFKLEFGYDMATHEIKIIDVLDLDSWRVLDENGNHVDKQTFRDNMALSMIQDIYRYMASLMPRVRIPKMALVLWRGSDKDEFPKLPEGLEKMIAVERVTCSMHRETRRGFRIIDELHVKYQDGGVFVVTVGLSNGAGPTISTHTPWLVISVPATLDKQPEDIWSSVNMPSNVPNATIRRPSNAIEAALNALALAHPGIYMLRQYEVEQRDPA